MKVDDDSNGKFPLAAGLSDVVFRNVMYNELLYKRRREETSFINTSVHFPYKRCKVSLRINSNIVQSLINYSSNSILNIEDITSNAEGTKLVNCT